jgi:pimeloyl-ACP methyl ester carboxylesterase
MIDLALARVPARDPDRRIGSLLVNPGGPGAPGRDFATYLADLVPDEIRDRFDIVGFDPRGTGETIPVECDERLDPLYATDWDPDTDAERTALEDANRAFVDSCFERSGVILPYVSSDRTVRDMDRIRAALGDEQLSYLGFSYGSYLGARYAEAYPDRVRALVLDGAVDPALDAIEVQVQQSAGFEHSLDLFLADCKRTGKCEFADGRDPAKAYDALRARVDKAPLRAGDGRELNQTLFDIGVTNMLYEGESVWSFLDRSLARAAGGDGSDLVASADAYTGRGDDGTYDDLQAAFIGIGCADGPPVGDAAGLREMEEAAVEEAPRVGASVVNNSMACAFWPIPAPPPSEVSAPGSEPILVLGTRNDPATPVAWARNLADQLESAVLVTVGGSRHTSFAAGNACVDLVVVRYLVDGATPRDGKRC